MDNFSNAAKLKVVGVGGAGGNAINDMIESNITTVDFIAINTDQQDLDRSKAPIKVLLGKGMGAGADPEKGRIAAKESEEKIKDVLEGTDMLFITAGMGGGTGTGASPIIAEVAKTMGILTVAIVTKPFSFEGPLKKNNAALGIDNLRENVDTLIAIPNDRLFEIPGMNISLMNAFKEANGVLKMGIKGISDLITKQGIVNLDFADVKSIMQNAQTISEKAGHDKANLLWGYIMEPELEGTISVSVVATDFEDEFLTNDSKASQTIRFAPSEEKKEEKPKEKENEKTNYQNEENNYEEEEKMEDTGDFVLPPFFEE